MLKLIECPRDAMQGLPGFIPTETKIRYLNLLLQVGFDTLDCGSFVSAKAIPQMQDSEAVLQELIKEGSQTKLLTIIANKRGAEKAAALEPVSYLGFPLSLSETFQQRNTNKSVTNAFAELATIQEICVRSGKELVVYLSMGFGNPYGDPWEAGYVGDFVQRLQPLGVNIISLSDTIGVAQPETISYLFSSLIPAFPAVEFGAHLHSRPDNWEPKIKAAYDAGCRRFDGALKGFGGCPMAKDELVGNLATENLVAYFKNNNLPLNLDTEALKRALTEADNVFSGNHG